MIGKSGLEQRVRGRNKFGNAKRAIGTVLAATALTVLLAACSGAEAAPPPTTVVEESYTPTAEVIPTETQEPTVTPVPTLEAVIFLDANLSTQQDDAQFYCPINHDEIEAIELYFPSAKGCRIGYLEHAPEPGLPGFVLSIEADGTTYKATTDAEGKATFSIPGMKPGDLFTAQIIEDPNEGTANSMQYINKLNNLVITDEQYIEGVVNGYPFLYPTKNPTFIDSDLIPLEASFPITVGMTNEIGLTQGYEGSPHGIIVDFFDLDLVPGKVLAYNGSTEASDYEPWKKLTTLSPDGPQVTAFDQNRYLKAFAGYSAGAIARAEGIVRLAQVVESWSTVHIETGFTAEYKGYSCNVMLISGNFSEIFVREGDKVHPGQIIGLIYPHDFKKMDYPDHPQQEEKTGIYERVGNVLECRGLAQYFDPFIGPSNESLHDSWTVNGLPVLPFGPLSDVGGKPIGQGSYFYYSPLNP